MSAVRPGDPVQIVLPDGTELEFIALAVNPDTGGMALLPDPENPPVPEQRGLEEGRRHVTLDPEVERAASEAADWIDGLDDDPTAEVHYVGLEQVWSQLSGTQREALMVDTGRHLYRRATLDALRRHDLVQAGGSGRTARGQALVDWVHAAGRAGPPAGSCPCAPR